MRGHQGRWQGRQEREAGGGVIVDSPERGDSGVECRTGWWWWKVAVLTAAVLGGETAVCWRSVLGACYCVVSPLEARSAVG